MSDFDRLIEEKRNSLKVKLQNDQDTIRGLGGIEPFPEGAFEKLTGNNIWENVLGYLKNPSDILNVSHTSKSFSEILDEQKKCVLLPEVLKVFKIEAQALAEDRSVRMRYWNSPVYKWSKHKDAICFAVRTVSRSWKEIADSQLFNSNFAKDDWFLTADVMEGFDSPRFGAHIFRNEKSVDRATIALSSLAELPSLSSILRNVHVYDDGASNSESYIRKINEFFKIHGNAVWFFSFKREYSQVIGYHWLCEMLENMPNLKGLCLLFPEDPTTKANFRRALNQRMFPSLNSLEHLDCSPSKVDELLLFQILSQSVNLRSVVYSQNQIITDEINEALKGLPLSRYEGLPPVITSNWSNRVSWPLRHLILKWGFETRKASVFFPALNRFRETLEHLEIWQPDIKMDVMDIPLDLPHLKVLSMPGVGRGRPGFDHLLPLKSLEKLIVWSVEDEYDNAKVIVKRYFDSLEMEKSNVWQCFPNLIHLEVKFNGWICLRPTRL